MKKTTTLFKSTALTIAITVLTAYVFPACTAYATEAMMLDGKSSSSEVISTANSDSEFILEDNSKTTEKEETEVLLDESTEPSTKDENSVLIDGNPESSEKEELEILSDTNTEASANKNDHILLDDTSETSSVEESATTSEEAVEYATHDHLLAASSLPQELLLGIFFNSQEDQSDTLYVSFDGLEFRKIGYAFEDYNKSSSEINYIKNSPHIIDPKKYPKYIVNCLHDPSLQFHNGNYWTMSGFTMNRDGDGKRVFVPMLASSPDLVNWTYPNSGSSTNVAPTLTPYGKSGNRDNANNFDTVAPDLLIEDNGTAWIVVCMGYYAQFHGDESKNDKMSPYLVKVTGLKPGSTNPVNIDEKGKQPILQYGNAIPINLPTNNYKNRIDGSLYKENGIYYLAIKDNGVTNEIWSINDLNKCQDSTQWKLVNKNVVTGYEGPWLTKYMGRYYCFTDQLETFPPDKPSGKTGIHMTCSEKLNTGWLANREITTLDTNGKKIPNRHGAVITIKDSKEIEKIMKLYYKAGWSYNPQKDKPDIPHLIWGYDGDGKAYWYENGKIQGATGDPKNIWDKIYHLERGREIMDPTAKAWFWLDCVYGGAAALDKEVWMPYIYQDEANFTEQEINNVASLSGTMANQVKNAIKTKTGKWVRYDYQGRMIKGWYMVDPNGRDAKIYPKQVGNVYYYDPQTGLMAKGWTDIWDEGQQRYIRHHFDEITGVLIR